MKTPTNPKGNGLCAGRKTTGCFYEQAHLLPEVIREAYDDVVRAKNFNELKAIVADLAEAQKRTEQRVAELAQAQKRTEERVDQLAAVVEKLAAAQDRTERVVKRLPRQVGGLSEALGGSLEDLALEVVPEILEYRWGMEIEFCDRETLPLRNGEYEFDLVIRDPMAEQPGLVLRDVKSNITESEVERFLTLVSQVEASEEIRPLFFWLSRGAGSQGLDSPTGCPHGDHTGYILPIGVS